MNTTPATTAPATSRQISYILDLAVKYGTRLPTDVEISNWTTKDASGIIAWYKARPLGQTADKAVAAKWVTVPAGHYALKVIDLTDDGADQSIEFYVVRDGSGKWEGRSFVSQVSGENEINIGSDRARNILKAISENTREALALYGKEIGRCGMCHRRLTDPVSREFGIGPSCRNKM